MIQFENLFWIYLKESNFTKQLLHIDFDLYENKKKEEQSSNEEQKFYS